MIEQFMKQEALCYREFDISLLKIVNYSKSVAFRSNGSHFKILFACLLSQMLARLDLTVVLKNPERESFSVY